MNQKLTRMLAGIGVLSAFGLGGAALAGAQGGQPASPPAASQSVNDRADGGDRGEARAAEQAVTGADAGRAGDAALKAVGSGEVLEVQRETPATGADRAEPGDKPDSAKERASDQKTAYSVEIQRSDGSKVDVSLDSAFKVLATEQDQERGEHANEANEAGEGAESASEQGAQEAPQPAAPNLAR